MEIIKCYDALTISQEATNHSNFNLSLFYKNALILCDNYICNQRVKLLNWYKHNKFICDYRIKIVQQENVQ